MRFKISVVIIGSMLFVGGGFAVANAVSENDTTRVITDNLSSLRSLPVVTNTLKPPDMINPDWLAAELAAEAAVQRAGRSSSSEGIVVNYNISTKGNITADLAEFKAQTQQTLNDSRGWSRMNVTFVEVDSGGTFTLVLSEANELPNFSSGCSIYYSCRVGGNIIINQDRWLGATDSWNEAGGSLRDYRHMVVNHEIGHWLGHDHLDCSAAGQSAPVMQQQSIGLQGCTFNPWPLDGELWSSQLGIAL